MLVCGAWRLSLCPHIILTATNTGNGNKIFEIWNDCDHVCIMASVNAEKVGLRCMLGSDSLSSKLSKFN